MHEFNKKKKKPNQSRKIYERETWFLKLTLLKW